MPKSPTLLLSTRLFIYEQNAITDSKEMPEYVIGQVKHMTHEELQELNSARLWNRLCACNY